MRIFRLICGPLFLFSFAFLLAQHSRASDFESPRTLALGGSGHAGPLLNDPIYLNPAFISFNQSYGIGFSFLKYSQGGYHGRDYNLSLQDGRTELFQAGIGYTVREDAALVHLVASKIIVPTVAVGVGGKMAISGSHTPKDMTVSMGMAANDWLQLAFIGDNLMQTPAGQVYGFNREFTVGSKFNIMRIVLAYVDPHFVPSATGNAKFGHEMGLEFPVMSDLFLRVGQFRNSNVFSQKGLRGNGWGAGFGWVAPRISLDYAFSRVTSTTNGLEAASAHHFGATIFF